MSSYATANRPAASHYSHSDEDLDSEEEEEERRLSEQHGEASDGDAAAATNRKRGPRTQANTTLTEEDAAAAKEFEETVRPKKVLRPSLQPSDLKSAGGLLFVRRSFPTQVSRYHRQASSSSSSSSLAQSKVRGAGVKSNELARKMNVSSEINAAARYSRSLMGAYRDFARELAPSLAAEDVFLKVEDMGSKKEVKDYLQLMRDEFRREYLTGIYGEEKAGRILNELEYGLRAAQRPAEEDEQYGGGGERASVAPRLGYAVSNDDADVLGSLSDAPLSSPPATVAAAVANPYTSTNKYGGSASSAETSSSAQAVEDVVAPSPRDDAATSAEMSCVEEDEEAEATFSVNGEDDVGVANSHISAELLAGEREEEDDAASTAAPTAEEDDGTEATAPEANDESESDKGSETQENEMNVAAEDHQRGDPNEINESTCVDVTLNANADNVVGGEDLSGKSEVLTVDDKTQETLTLVESQLDNYNEYSQDERFSQVSEKLADEEAPTQIPCTQDDRFSQTQDDRFSQEDNTADERFSQFTPGMFEVDAGEKNPTSWELGQTE